MEWGRMFKKNRRDKYWDNIKYITSDKLDAESNQTL